MSLTHALKWQGRNCVQVTCNTLGACHVHHVFQVVRRGSSAVEFDRVEIALSFVFFSETHSLMKQGRELEYTTPLKKQNKTKQQKTTTNKQKKKQNKKTKNPDNELQKMSRLSGTYDIFCYGGTRLSQT